MLQMVLKTVKFFVDDKYTIKVFITVHTQILQVSWVSTLSKSLREPQQIYSLSQNLCDRVERV